MSWYTRFESDCGSCRGLCCVGFCFSKRSGFPCDKAAGERCPNLTPDDRCAIHDQLAARGCHGCAAYDCMGAGQRATAIAAGEQALLLPVFAVTNALYPMLRYLAELGACGDAGAQALCDELDALLGQPAQSVARLVPEQYRLRVNALLQAAVGSAEYPVSLPGKSLRGQKLTGRDFTMALLIAADLRGCDCGGVSFLGADLRDARLGGADLSGSRFLTQMQLATAKGDGQTKLPPWLHYPARWAK